jgi:P27 family predicted phage terminase small subunit
VPECPEALDATGRAKWRALVVLLGDVGILTLIDSDVLEVYCETYSRWRQACAEVRKSGAWHLTQQGLCETPASRIAKVLGAELRQLCGELGLSPASRAGLKVTAPKGKGNALSAFTA